VDDPARAARGLAFAVAPSWAAEAHPKEAHPNAATHPNKDAHPRRIEVMNRDRNLAKQASKS